MFRRRPVKPSPPVPAAVTSVDVLRDQLADLVRSWRRTSGDLHVATLKPGASLTHRQISDAQARLLNAAAAELHALIRRHP